ncbi:MAG: hypothetical protein QNJ78_06415 [Gammaproteobacteria bacterium]|nr:hypothetical protein [Gammaproteobacteria bacterium]
MLIEYTARESVQSGHVAGTAYNIEVARSNQDRSFGKVGSLPTALAGNSVSIVQRMEERYTIVTMLHEKYQVTDILDMREFLDSVSRHESFYIDDIEGETTNNLIAKPTFEDGLFGDWETSAGQTIVPVTWSQASKAYQLVDNVAGYNGVQIPVVAGETLNFEMWVDASGATNSVRAGVKAFQSDQTTVISYPEFFTVLPSEGYAFGSGSIEVPALCAYVEPLLILATPSPYGTADVSHIRMYRKSNPQLYILEGRYQEQRLDNGFYRFTFTVRKL